MDRAGEGNTQNQPQVRPRNFALACAAVMLRLLLPVGVIAGSPFEATYQAVAWLCWLPQWLLVEAWMARRPTAPFQALRLPS